MNDIARLVGQFHNAVHAVAVVLAFIVLAMTIWKNRNLQPQDASWVAIALCAIAYVTK